MNVLFAILILPFVLVSSKNSYIVTVPKVIRPGSVANVCVHIIKNRINSATITASLLTPDNKTISTVVKQVRPRVAEVLKLQVPQNVQASFEYKIRVAGSGGISFQKTAIRIEVASKATSLFIQTDRPVYKPGDLVRFRVVGIHPNLLTVKEPMDIVVYDPKQNRLKQFLGVKQDFDVFAGDLQLSTLTTHGSWRIEVKQLGKKMSQNFEVKEYVLPKFEVNIIIPPLQLTTDEYFRFTVTAIYTFGKPIFGEVEVTLGYTFSSDKITKKFKINGKADINILMREIQPRLGRYIPIFANVTETITGNIANASANARIYDYQEKMSFSSNLPSIFKPGLQYTYVLRVTKMDDSLLDPPAGEVNITVYYSVYRKTSTKPTFVDEFQEMRKFYTRCPSLPPTDEKMLYSKQIVIPPNGVLSQDVLLPKDAVRARIVAYYRKTSSYLYLQRAGSASNNFIQVRIKDEAKAEPGKPLELILTGTENVLLCYYKIFSKGSLIVQGRFTSCLTGSNTSNKRIRITATMAPTALFLIYYVRPSGEIVADSISFPISEIFENKVAIKFNKDRVLPAETVKLEITADPNSLVNVLSVDKSILLIATSNDITVEKKSWRWWCKVCDDVSFDRRWVVERHVIERHSEFTWRCPDCRKLFQRKMSPHGCRVTEKEMICFHNSSGLRGKEAEAQLELYRKKELCRKIKLTNPEGQEVALDAFPRGRPYAASEKSVNKRKATKDLEAGDIKRRKDKTNDDQDKENPKMMLKPGASKEEKINAIRTVLRDFSSEFGDNLTITLETDSDVVDKSDQEKAVEIHAPDDSFSVVRSKMSKSSSSSSSSTSASSTSSSGSSSHQPASEKKGSVKKADETTCMPPPSRVERKVVTVPTDPVETFLHGLQETQENTLILNIGGVKFETSKTTLRADPSSVFALMLNPNSPFRPSNNIYFFDRDPAHFKIILNYLRNNCNIEKRYLPREHLYLYELLVEA